MDRRRKSPDSLAVKFISYLESPTTAQFPETEHLETLSENERLYFLNQVDIPGRLNTIPSLCIHTALSSSTKYVLGAYLLARFPFSLHVNESDAEGRSLLQLLIERRKMLDFYDLQYALIGLYKRGYINKGDDIKNLAKAYKEDVDSEHDFEKWCLCRFAYLINDADLLSKAFGNVKVLFTILSFKQKRPIGIRYPNLLGVMNSALLHYREVGDTILRASKHYGVYDDIEKRDKKGNFSFKLNDYKEYRPVQNKEFEQVIYRVFPELKITSDAIAS